MKTHDMNSLLDPERVPTSATGNREVRLHGQLDTDSQDLLDAVEGGTVPELTEEPPWLADFLAHYKLVFGNTGGGAPATGRSEPVRIVEARAVSYEVQKNNQETGELDQTFSNDTNGPLKNVEPPREIFEYAVSERWSWIHIALAMTLAALLAGLVVMFVRPTHRQKGSSSGLADPIVGANLPIVQAAAPVATPVTTATAASREQAGQTVLLHKVLPVYPRTAHAQKLEGDVSLQAEISPEGKVRTVTVLSGDPILAQAAVEAVRHWIYSPSPVDQADPRLQQVTIHFKAP